jgi:DNA-binding Lrp family transcriptional regulator
LRSGQHSSRRRWLGRDVRGGEGHNVLGLVRVLRERIASYVTEGIERARALRRMPEIIDVYEVTGEYDIIATARTNDLHKLKVVTTSVVLHTYKLNSKEIFE